MRTFIAFYASGDTIQYIWSGEGPRYRPDDGMTDEVETPRFGSDAETWDREAGACVADLDRSRGLALATIDACRLSLIAAPTARTAIDDEYDAKLREAGREDGPWPYLSAEATLRGEPVTATRDRVLARAAAAEVATAERRAHVSAVAVIAKDAVRVAAGAVEIERLTAQAITTMQGDTS